LVNKIKSSLSAKVFLWVSTSLILCSILIFGIIIIALPHSYKVVASDRIQQEVDTLVAELSQTTFEQGKKRISEFCIHNSASAILVTDNTSISFGTITKSQNDKETSTVVTNVRFTDKTSQSFLTVTTTISTESEITESFLKLLPFILLFTVLISAASALMCNRILVKPIVEISSISKRMSQLDMTWRCKVNRSDEVGVLACSLNDMAQRLDDVINSWRLRTISSGKIFL